jgi:hypothetical protein
MGQTLMENDADIRGDLVGMDAILQRLAHPPAWSLIGTVRWSL